MNRYLQRKRIIIIAIWLVFMALSTILYFVVENDKYDEKARKELQDQTDIVEGQVYSIVENDYYSEQIVRDLVMAKSRALEMALEPYDDISDAREVIYDFATTADVEGLNIYDKDGKVIYHYGDEFWLDFNKDEYIPALESGLLSKTHKADKFSEDYMIDMFPYYGDQEVEPLDMWGLNKKWVLVMEDLETDAEKKLLDYFEWSNVLQSVSIGSRGSLLAIDSWQSPGTILSFWDMNLRGKNVEELKIKIEGANTSATIDELQKSFEDPQKVVKANISGTDYYAVRVECDGVFLLALMPVAEIVKNANEMAGILAMITLLSTGIMMLYAFFHVRNDNSSVIHFGKYVWDNSLAFKLESRGVLTLISVLILTLLFCTLSLYADIFRYCQDKSENVVTVLEENNAAYEMLMDWSDEEYYTKCRIAECVIRHTDKELVDADFLDKLSDKLAIRYINVFDDKGKLVVTNSPFSTMVIDNESPFYSLLEGRSYYIDKQGYDELADEVLQKIGISIRDEDNQVTGIVMIMEDTLAQMEIFNNLGDEGVFSKICLEDDTFVLVVTDENMIIKYLAEVEGSNYEKGLDSFDYTGLPVSVLGINEARLRDYYNGNMLVLSNKYFASIRRSGDNYYMVMLPQISLNSGQLLAVAISVAATFIFLIILTVVMCLHKNHYDVNEQVTEQGDSEEKRKTRIWEEEHAALVTSLMEKKNYGFDERWPNDGVRWKDKSEDEKFVSASRSIISFAFFMIVIEAIMNGQRSIWYYCISGEWDSGVNLYSVTSCVITICALIMVKVISHGMLYLVASAVNAKGETICHLVDSSLGYVLFIVSVFLCLNHIGVNTAALSLTGGIAGLIFGIGCQNVVMDILAGIFMTFEGVVRVGDYVSYNGVYGSVMKVGVRTTRIKRFGEMIIVRNNDLKNFINVTIADSDARIVCTINVDLRESLERVEAVINTELPAIKERIEQEENVSIDQLTYQGISEITEKGMTMNFVIFCPNWYYVRVMNALYRELKLMCDRNNIRIAMPQVEIRNP